MTRKIFIAIILFTLTLAGKLIVDLSLYYSGGVNNHTLGAAIVFICLSACSWLSGWRSIPMWFFGWWAIWDTLYALFIGQDWNYIGNTAWLDKLQINYPALQWFKYIVATVTTGMFIAWKFGKLNLWTKKA